MHLMKLVTVLGCFSFSIFASQCPQVLSGYIFVNTLPSFGERPNFTAVGAYGNVVLIGSRKEDKQGAFTGQRTEHVLRSPHSFSALNATQSPRESTVLTTSGNTLLSAAVWKDDEGQVVLGVYAQNTSHVLEQKATGLLHKEVITSVMPKTKKLQASPGLPNVHLLPAQDDSGWVVAFISGHEPAAFAFKMVERSNENPAFADIAWRDLKIVQGVSAEPSNPAANLSLVDLRDYSYQILYVGGKYILHRIPFPKTAPQSVVVYPGENTPTDFEGHRMMVYKADSSVEVRGGFDGKVLGKHLGLKSRGARPLVAFVPRSSEVFIWQLSDPEVEEMVTKHRPVEEKYRTFHARLWDVDTDQVRQFTRRAVFESSEADLGDLYAGNAVNLFLSGSAIDPSGRKLFAATNQGKIHVLDLEKAEFLGTHTPSSDASSKGIAISDLAYVEATQTLVILYANGEVHREPLAPLFAKIKLN